jgi:aflatoxin B1 aldehyde reductase
LGYFRRFGLSNFLAEDVQRVYDYAKEHGYVLPTVYQGNYSAVARLQEQLLFPTLRKLGMAFYAYSPLAGGFLTKTAGDIKEGKGRFNDAFFGGMYKDMYVKSTYVDALAKWGAVAEAEGVSRAELACRWVAFNPLLSKENGDGIIIGARNNEQLEQTLVSLKKGRLSGRATRAIDEIWEAIKHEAPYDNVNRSLL